MRSGNIAGEPYSTEVVLAPAEKKQGLQSLPEKCLRFARRWPLGAAGALVIGVMLITALFASYIAPHDPLETNFLRQLQGPRPGYWLGTDSFGRDVLSRLIYGSRTALLIGFSASLIGTTLGLALGLVSAYFGGLTDLLLQWLNDVLLAVPIVVLALVFIAVLGSGTENVILAIAIPFVPSTARVIRSSALAIRAMPFVEAATSLGASDLRIIFRHMLPNVMAPYLVLLTAFQAQAVLLEASLSFLGLGVAEPTPAWGLMLKGGAIEYAESAPWLAIFPGIAISLSVFAFNLFGDSLRDALDPRLRTQR
jgi:peptide/nickel transport system permease protein